MTLLSSFIHLHVVPRHLTNFLFWSRKGGKSTIKVATVTDLLNLIFILGALIHNMLIIGQEQ